MSVIALYNLKKMRFRVPSRVWLKQSFACLTYVYELLQDLSMESGAMPASCCSVVCTTCRRKAELRGGLAVKASTVCTTCRRKAELRGGLAVKASTNSPYFLLMQVHTTTRQFTLISLSLWRLDRCPTSSISLSCGAALYGTYVVIIASAWLLCFVLCPISGRSHICVLKLACVVFLYNRMCMHEARGMQVVWHK